VYFSIISSIFKSRASLQLENMMLGKQIDILMRRQKRPLVHNRDICKEFDLIWDNLEKDDKRNILNLLVSKIEVSIQKISKNGQNYR